MSSILRALKQAERASANQADQQDPSDRTQALLRPTVVQQRRYALGPVMLFFLLIVIAGTGTALYFNFFFPEKRPLQPPGNQVSSPAPAPSPAHMKDQTQQGKVPSKTADIPSGQQDDSIRSLATPSEPSKSTPRISDSLDDESTAVVQSIPAEPSMTIPKTSDTLTAGSEAVVQSEPAADSATVLEETPILKEAAVTSLVKNIPKERTPPSRKKPNTGLTDKKTADAQALTSIPEKSEDSIASKDKDEGAGESPGTQEIPRLEDSPFKVQAISWSEDADRRIAVIDDRVLSEGDRVQGYRLITIEKDSVILRHQGKNYRLLFSYR